MIRGTGPPAFWGHDSQEGAEGCREMGKRRESRKGGNGGGGREVAGCCLKRCGIELSWYPGGVIWEGVGGNGQCSPILCLLSSQTNCPTQLLEYDYTMPIYPSSHPRSPLPHTSIIPHPRPRPLSPSSPGTSFTRPGARTLMFACLGMGGRLSSNYLMRGMVQRCRAVRGRSCVKP